MALDFVSNVLPESVTLEKYSGVFNYTRFAGHKGPSETYFTLCPNIHEEKTVIYNVLIDYTAATSTTTDFADITNLVGDPSITYLNSASSFESSSIIPRAYKDYQQTH